MNGRTRRLAGAMALVAGVAACRGGDAAVAPRAPAPPAFAAAANQSGNLHVVANGDYAYANGSAADESGGVTVFSLYVWRTGSRADSGAFISYDVGRCDALLNCVITESGDGEIPNGDLTGRAAGGLHLETNTATNPDVVKDGPGGLIVIDWKKTGDWTVFYSGTQVHRSPGHTWRRQGTTTDHSAVASGQALGIPAAGGYAQVGTSHEVQLEVGRERGRLPMLDARLTSSPDATLSSSLSAGGPVGPAFVVGGGPSVQFVANGDAASAEWSIEDEDGRTAGYVWVTRGTRTEVGYGIVRCEPPPSGECTRWSGYGPIPDGDLTGSGAGGLHLRTNTAGLPDFNQTGPDGVIEVDWKRTALWVDVLSGAATWQDSISTERRRGKETRISATASGEILGVPIPPGAVAQVGTSHSVRIVIERRP
ncbi:MAG TPA: hypothetical protein VKP10_10465 [Gemmatimonadales bacterium]|nr:hypothetical protein [Gemmatimonadales bacterium]